MLIQQMHIELDLELRKMNSSVLQSLLDEQKDWLLNKSILQFVKQRRNPKSNPSREGYQETRKRYNDLEELQETVDLPVYRLDAESVFAIIPQNCYLTDKDNSKLAWDCRDVSLTQVPKTIYYCIAPLKTGGTTSPFYQGFKIEITDLSANTTTLFDLSVDYPYFSTGLSTNEEKFVIVDLVLDKLNSIPGVEARWEKWDEVYARESFIILTTDTVTGLPVNNTSISITHYTGAIVQTTNFTSKVFTGYTHSISKIAISSNRLAKSEDLRNILNLPFYKTRYTSPVSREQKGRIIVFHDKKFILNTLQLEYIRKPKKVNLHLGISCDLRDEVHEEVVSLTVQRCKALLEAKNYKEIINENLSQE